jgi:hypothetical protein
MNPQQSGAKRLESVLSPFLAIALLLSSVLVFHKPLEKLLNALLVERIFRYVERAWYNDVLFIAGLLFIAIRTVLRLHRHAPSLSLVLMTSALAIVYSFYRFGAEVWTFTPLKMCPTVKYTDLIFPILVCQLILSTKGKRRLPKKSSEAFRDDEPLGVSKPDELGYNEYAKRLSIKILNSHFDKAFAIGVNGRWGLGKTSFIDLLKRNLAGHNFIEVNFNPWNSNNPKAIIQDFFDTIQAEIRPYHSTLSRLLIQYSNKLITLDDNAVSRSIHAVVTFVTGFESIGSLFDEINTTLKSIDRKIIIFIDDLDRLDKEEIIEVIRLMRNTANFYNTFFVVAYDKNYVTAALREHNPYNSEKFLEKIFQIEVTLPHFRKDVFRHKLAENLRDSFPQQYHETVEREILGTASMKPVYLNDWLETMRDVTRLTNALDLNLYLLIGEVDFFDFLRLELLRLKYQSVYELLFKKTDEFLVSTNANDREFTYQLREIDKGDRNLTDKEKTRGNYLELYLRDNHAQLSFPVNETDKVVELIANIFIKSRAFGTTSRSHLSVVHPSKFSRYFAYNLLEGNLSEIAFSKGRSSSQEAFNQLIATWVNEGYEYELRDRFGRIKSFDGREDFEKVIRGIFHLANQEAKNKDNPTRALVGYDAQDLLYKLNNYDENIQQKFYPGPKGKEEYQAFVRDLFLNAVSPYKFESEIATKINNDINDDFGIPKAEFEEILLSYFKAYSEEVGSLDRTTWQLFHRCRRSHRVDNGGGSFIRTEEIIPEAKPLMESIIQKNFDTFLLALIDPEIFEKKTFAVSQFVLSQYGSWEAFKAMLNQMDESKWTYLREFKEFFATFESKNYSVYVPFEFKDIPIHQKNGA